MEFIIFALASICIFISCRGCFFLNRLCVLWRNFLERLYWMGELTKKGEIELPISQHYTGIPFWAGSENASFVTAKSLSYAFSPRKAADAVTQRFYKRYVLST